MIDIFHAEEKHLRGILEIERQEFSVPWSEVSFREEMTQNSIFLVAGDEENLLGFCIMRRFMDEGEIFNIAVKKEFKRQGIGSALLGAACAEASLLGVKKVFLEVRESNRGAIDLYTGAGFRFCGLRKNYYEKPTENAILMTADI